MKCEWRDQNGNTLSLENGYLMLITEGGHVSGFACTSETMASIAAALRTGARPEAPSDTRTLEERRTQYIESLQPAMSRPMAAMHWHALVAAGVVRP